MSIHLRAVVHLAATCLALAECDSSTGSRPLADTYLLQTVDGRPVPATVDSVVAADGVTYTLHVMAGGSLEILGVDSARYTVSRRQVTFSGPNPIAFAADCIAVPVQYRTRGDELVLVIEPTHIGQTGHLRLDTLHIANGKLVFDTRNGSGAPLRLEYGASVQPFRCDGVNP